MSNDMSVTLTTKLVGISNYGSALAIVLATYIGDMTVRTYLGGSVWRSCCWGDVEVNREVIMLPVQSSSWLVSFQL